MRNIHVGQRLYINGQSQTEEYIIAKITPKYATFVDSPHRYIRESDLLQKRIKSNWEPSGKQVFISREDAEYYLEGVIQK
jgi:hypothetical protein